MISNKHSQELAKNGSGIRKMFELGKQFEKEGKKPIDLSLGNPNIKPPADYYKSLEDIYYQDKSSPFNYHSYPTAQGIPEVRERVAKYLSMNIFPSRGFVKEDIIMTAGAANALNILMMSLIEPKEINQEKDEVICIAPYFVGYNSYINNAGGKIVPVFSNDKFHLNIHEIEEAITSKTKAVIINSPNNPTGVVYSQTELDSLGYVLNNKYFKLNKMVSVIEDAPYYELVFSQEANAVASMLNSYSSVFHINSFSKWLGLAGERIGYLAISPGVGNDKEDRQNFIDSLIVNIGSTVVNAPLLQQRIIANMGSWFNKDIKKYEGRVRSLEETLIKNGFSLVSPQGAFYLFPKIPDKFDSLEEFQRYCLKGKEPLLFTAGAAFGGEKYNRHIRLSACVSEETIERAKRRLTEICSEK